MSDTQLATSYRDRLNELHEHAVRCAWGLHGKALETLNATRAVGVQLEAAKSNLRPDQWRELQAELNFGPQRDQAVQTYLDFARKNPEEITDMTEGWRSLQSSMQVTGLLPFPEGHGPQVLHAPNLFSYWAKSLTSQRSELKKRLSREPIETWSPEAAEQFVAQTEPFVQDLNAIMDKARERMEAA